MKLSNNFATICTRVQIVTQSSLSSYVWVLIRYQRTVNLHGMTTRTQANTASTGAAAEDAVAAYVTRLGWRVIARNVRRREGELDLIGVDGGTLVFVEVKGLRASGDAPPFSPFESIDSRKADRIRTLARHWLIDELRRFELEDPLYFASIRFDAFAVTLGRGNNVIDIAHVRDAF